VAAAIGPFLPGPASGPYQIDALLERAELGEVYRARDTRLGRDIAVKVLPDAVASSPDRLARFEREAKAVASLNIPTSSLCTPSRRWPGPAS